MTARNIAVIKEKNQCDVEIENFQQQNVIYKTLSHINIHKFFYHFYTNIYEQKDIQISNILISFQIKMKSIIGKLF